MNFANIVTSLGFSEEAAAKIALEWDASFKNNADPSGRAMSSVHEQGYTQK